jgi:hypothetical protein
LNGGPVAAFHNRIELTISRHGTASATSVPVVPAVGFGHTDTVATLFFMEGHPLAKPTDISIVETSVEKRNRMMAEGKVALAEYAARSAAVDKNTLRLRALRLAKEAADREAALLNPQPEPVKKKRRKAAPSQA